MLLLWLGRLFLLVGYPSLVAMPFGPEWLKLAKGVVAGEFSDELLRSFTLHDRCSRSCLTTLSQKSVSLQKRSITVCRLAARQRWGSSILNRLSTSCCRLPSGPRGSPLDSEPLLSSCCTFLCPCEACFWFGGWQKSGWKIYKHENKMM